MANVEIFDLSEETIPNAAWNLAIQKTLGGDFYRMGLNNLLASFKVTAQGDLLYGSAASTLARLGIGAAGKVLKVNSGGTLPEWGTVTVGKQRQYFPVSWMSPLLAGSPASIAIAEIYFPVIAFDPTIYEAAALSWVFPKKYDGGDIKFRAFGVQSGTNTGNVVFEIEAISIASGSGFAAGASASVLIAMPGSDGTVKASSWSSSFGAAKLNAGELTLMRFRRAGSSGSDTYPDDFQLLGVEIEWSSNAENDD